MSYLEHPSIKLRDKVTQLCTPLFEYFDLTGFCYDMSFTGGDLSMLTDNIELFETYYSRDLNPVCSNGFGRTLAPGIYTTRMLKDKHNDEIPFSYLSSLYKTSLGIHIVDHVDGYDEMTSFGCKMSFDDFDYFVLNHQVQLKNFVRYFRHALRAEITELAKKENRLHFPDLLTHSIDQVTLHKREDLKELRLLLETGHEVIIPPQQAACLKLLKAELSVKQIAATLFLSTRTVEHYLTAARARLSCKSILTMMCKYGDQL